MIWGYALRTGGLYFCTTYGFQTKEEAEEAAREKIGQSKGFEYVTFARKSVDMDD